MPSEEKGRNRCKPAIGQPNTRRGSAYDADATPFADFPRAELIACNGECPADTSSLGFAVERGEQVCGIELIARGACFVRAQGSAIHVRNFVSRVTRSFPRVVFCQEGLVLSSAIHFPLGGRGRCDYTERCEANET